VVHITLTYKTALSYTAIVKKQSLIKKSSNYEARKSQQEVIMKNLTGKNILITGAERAMDSFTGRKSS